jgi:hypothetical protein
VTLALAAIVVVSLLLVGYFLITRQDSLQREEVLHAQATETAYVTATAQAATATSHAIKVTNTPPSVTGGRP